MDICSNERMGRLLAATDFAQYKTAESVRKFHSEFPEYKKTPLWKLSDLARELGIGDIFIKDESYRFGLNAFKALGGSYAVAKYLAKCLGQEKLSYEYFVSNEAKEKIGELTFVTATDGNHGRGIAWTAARLGQKAVVYMPKGTVLERVERIRDLGAEVIVTEENYDGAVRLAQEMSQKKGMVLIQDTGWKGYETIPRWIMQGYLTMALEADEQLGKCGDKPPTHLILQVGVGSMAASVIGYFRHKYGKRSPRILIVEPNRADCGFRSIKSGTGNPCRVDGEMSTIMAGLACGELSSLAWPILESYGEVFFSCSDSLAAEGMRILGAPVGADPRVISGESGAIGMGVLWKLLTDSVYQELRTQIGLNEHARVLLFSTEGATDQKNYRDIVWNGTYAVS